MKMPNRISKHLATIALLAGALALVVASSACNEAGGSTAPARAAAANAKLQQATFDVDGMTCASCNVAVSIAAKQVDGVTDARASNEKKKAWITYDANQTNPETIAAAITKAGYKATPVKATGGA